MIRRLLAPMLALAVIGCSTIGQPVTPGQKLFASLGAYSAALSGARTYAMSPGASHAIIRRLNDASQAALPVVRFADAYRLCSAGATEAQGVPCVTFDFTSASLNRNATLLRDFVAKLAER